MKTEDYVYLHRTWGGSAQPIAELRTQGRHFYQGADIWKGCGITGFRAYQLFLKGEMSQLGDYVSWWTGAGGNLMRVFFTHGAPADNQFLPWQYPNYYDRVGEFMGWMQGRGCRVLATCLTGQVPGWPEYMPQDQRKRHVVAISTAAGQTHLVEGINENFKNGQIDIPAEWFAGALWNLSCWVWTEQAPKGRWAAIHPERKEPTQCVRKCHDIIEVPFDGPRGITEWGQTLRDITTIGRNHTAGAGSSLFGSFTIAHGAWETVQQCRVPSGDERTAFEAHARGFNSLVIPRDSAGQGYRADEDAGLEFVLGGPAVPENPGYGCQHLYEMGSTDVVVEATDDFRRVPKPGRRIIVEDESSVHLE